MPVSSKPARTALYIVQAVLVAAVYFAAAKASLRLAIPPGYATAVWPPSGIALAAMLMLRSPTWPGIWLGAAAVNYTVNYSLAAAALIGCGNTLEAIVGAALIRRFTEVPGLFLRAEDTLKFIVISALSATVAATVALVPLSFSHPMTWQDISWNWWTWWQGDACGMIIVAPLILSWFHAEEARWPWHRFVEAFCLGTLLIAATLVIFRAGADSPVPGQYSFLIVPFIVLVAFRFGQREMTTAVAAVCGVALWHTVDGRGPLVSASLNESLLLMLAFVSTLVATGLVLSSIVGERRRAMEALGRARDELQNQAVTDPLTGLYNRRYLGEFMRRELARGGRRGAPFAVIMLDLDHFKRVNDTYGHDAGDRVLTAAAELLKTQIRASDIACRYGGEEFALVLPDAGLAAAQTRAENIRAALKELRPEHRGNVLRVTASLGVAVFPEHGETMDELVAASDEALYAAKKAGRDRIATASAGPGTRQATSERMTIPFRGRRAQ